jgi:hypothetical protein
LLLLGRILLEVIEDKRRAQNPLQRLEREEGLGRLGVVGLIDGDHEAAVFSRRMDLDAVEADRRSCTLSAASGRV